MILPIVKYGHPILRRKGARIETVTLEIRQLITDMLETMKSAKGIGLAAQQVGYALQLAVLDVEGITDRPSTIEVNGQPIDVDAFMPLVVINPEATAVGPLICSPEGCLSFPEVFSEVARPSLVDIRAVNHKGQRLEFRCGGLLARAIQHEIDHLNGILFIDRMSSQDKNLVQDQLDEIQAESKGQLKAALAR